MPCGKVYVSVKFVQPHIDCGLVQFFLKKLSFTPCKPDQSLLGVELQAVLGILKMQDPTGIIF